MDDPNAYAASEIRDFADEADVALGAGFWDRDSEDQRITLTHELLHVLMYRLHQHHRAIRDQLGAEAQTIVKDETRRIEEVLIDHLARTIAPNLPRVDIPKHGPPEKGTP